MQTNFPASDYAGEEDAQQRDTQAQQDDMQAAAATMLLAGATDTAANAIRQARFETAPSHGTSRFKGVSWSARSQKWRAQLWFANNVRALTRSAAHDNGPAAISLDSQAL